MKRTFLIAASLIAVSSVGAFAAPKQFHATLANPAKEHNFAAEVAIWHCEGTACVTTSDVSDDGAKSTCRALARKAGPVTSFDDLDAAQLQTCNGK